MSKRKPEENDEVDIKKVKSDDEVDVKKVKSDDEVDIKKVKSDDEDLTSISTKEPSTYSSLYDDVVGNGVLDKKNGRNLRQKCFNYVDAKKKKVPLHMIKAKKLLFDDPSVFKESQYYFEHGLRKVEPYFYTFDTFCKERWLGKTLREIYSKEFRLYPIEVYEQAAASGNLLLNLNRVKSLDTVVKNNDLISTKLHRHEGPVTAAPIEILVDNGKYLVVNKPSGLPIHPCSRYRDNTLLFILAKEHEYMHIHTCHRIDLLTSGVCIFAKTKYVAQTLTKEICERKVEKEYVCKVVGEFPDKGEEGYHCDAPITNINPKLGYVVAWHVEGRASKTAETTFHRISTDGETSVVLCRPKTGRTHQIRAHLQLLGFPIVNDPIYNHSAWGESRFKYGPCELDLEKVVDQIITQWKNNPLRMHGGVGGVEDKSPLEGAEEEDKSPLEGAEQEDKPPQEGAEVVRVRKFYPNCPECVKPLPDPNPKALVMYLHALKYKGDSWMFETPMPEWAK